MLKKIKNLFLLLVIVVITFVLTGCKLVDKDDVFNFSNKADNVEEKFNDGSIEKLSEIVDMMGDPTFEAVFNASGVAIWLEKRDEEDINEVLKNGEETESLIVYLVNGEIEDVKVKNSFKGINYYDFKDILGTPTYECNFIEKGFAVWENETKTKALFIGIINDKMISFEINNKYENLKYEDIKEFLGNATYEFELMGTGVATWADGCENLEEYEAKKTSGEMVATLTVVFQNGVVTKFEYIKE